MDFCGRDQAGSFISPGNEADSGYEPSPSSTSGPCTMFSFESEEYSDPEDSISNGSEDEGDDDTLPSLTGRPSSSPISIPLPECSVLLSHSTPGFGCSVSSSPLRRFSCPSQILVQQNLVRIVRHVATQTRSSTDSIFHDSSGGENIDTNEHRLAPMQGPLPDLIQHNGPRLGHLERTRSASVSLPVGSHMARSVEVGQTLRRLSDDFERTRRQNLVMRSRYSPSRQRSLSQSDT